MHAKAFNSQRAPLAWGNVTSLWTPPNENLRMHCLPSRIAPAGGACSSELGPSTACQCIRRDDRRRVLHSRGLFLRPSARSDPNIAPRVAPLPGILNSLQRYSCVSVHVLHVAAESPRQLRQSEMAFRRYRQWVASCNHRRPQ